MAFAAARREKFGFGFFGLSKGEFWGNREVSVELWVELLDASEDEAREFDGREFALAEEACDFLDGGEGEIGVIHWWHGSRCEWGI